MPGNFAHYGKNALVGHASRFNLFSNHLLPIGRIVIIIGLYFSLAAKEKY
jgi:hypothetical protein